MVNSKNNSPQRDDVVEMNNSLGFLVFTCPGVTRHDKPKAVEDGATATKSQLTEDQLPQ